jgi:5,10-methylenetetrahydromethanopterin reductase
MPGRVRVALRIPGTEPVPELVGWIREAEAAGFDGVGILDSQMIGRDTFVILGAAAAQTSRLRLFPAVSNPFTRHLSVLAGATVTVEELAPERIACVIGSGYTAAMTIGRKRATLAEMRAAIVGLKGLLAGDSVDFAGTPGRLQFAGQRPIPVLMAASGPRAIELAGEVADGVMLLVGFTPGIAAAALERLEAGARRGGRRLEDLEIIWAVRTCTAGSTAEARRHARPTAVHWGLLHAGGHWLRYVGPRRPALAGGTWLPGYKCCQNPLGRRTHFCTDASLQQSRNGAVGPRVEVYVEIYEDWPDHGGDARIPVARAILFRPR